ncbi:MAG: PAS domain-containing sensor histidine kinase [Anaerolineae bacterium]
MSISKSYEQLLDENTALQARLKEAEDTLEAVRRGEVDAFVLSTAQGHQVYTLQSADQPYRLLIEDMQQGAVTLSIEGVILYSNRFFSGFLGYSSTADLVSHCIDEYLVASEHERFRCFLERLQTETGLAEEFKFQDSQQQVIPTYLLANSMVIDQIRIVYLVVVDLRQRKQLEQQAFELALEKQRANLLTELMRYISHDLRHPLTNIITSIYIIQHTQDDQRKSQKFEEIEHQVFYLSRDLEQLQQMLRLDSMTELSLEEGRLNDAILNVVEQQRTEAHQQGIVISAELPSHPIQVWFDSTLMQEAISELLTNAIRYTPSGGTVHIRCAFAEDDHCLLEVTNNGDGIPSDKLPHVFDRFYKVDDARSLHRGLGLGLSMVKRIIELHHGWIEAESTPGEVTHVRITLPLALTDQ